MIDELEKKYEQAAQASAQQASLNASANSGKKESEQVRKMKLDNQVLIGQLSQYKKAEKNVKEIAREYEQMKSENDIMKVKYFNVLTENEKQKTQIQDLISKSCDKEGEMKALLKERDVQINEMYALRVDTNKRINQLEEKNQQIQALTDKLVEEREKAQKILQSEQEVAQLKGDIHTYMDILTEVMKHFKTLLKTLHDQVSGAKDPTVIEHTNRQIRAINSLKQEVRRSIRASSKRASRERGCLDLYAGFSASEVEGRGSILSSRGQFQELEHDANRREPTKRVRLDVKKEGEKEAETKAKLIAALEDNDDQPVIQHIELI